MCRMHLVPLFLAALFAALAPDKAAAQDKPGSIIQIGMVKSFFNGVPDELAELVIAPFGDVMKANTERDGKLNIVADTCDLTERITAGKMQLGVFHGHEFAWAKQKEPKLVPLVIIVNDHHEVAGYVIVKKDSAAQKLCDLRGNSFDVPKMSKEHCKVFVERHCTDNGTPNLKKFFSTLKHANSVYDALDDVAAGRTDAMVADTIALEFYKQIRGAVFNKHLRVLQKSIAYPAPVIAYKEGTFDAATLKILRDGLLKAHESPDGKALLRDWSINRFETVPANYQELLTRALKEHPLPESPVKVGMR